MQPHLHLLRLHADCPHVIWQVVDFLTERLPPSAVGGATGAKVPAWLTFTQTQWSTAPADALRAASYAQ